MAQVLKEEVRNRILEAAEKVFYKKDYRGAKLTEIAKEADIPVALIYTYFKNKAVLFDAVVSSVYITSSQLLMRKNLWKKVLLLKGLMKLEKIIFMNF